MGDWEGGWGWLGDGLTAVGVRCSGEYKLNVNTSCIGNHGTVLDDGLDCTPDTLYVDSDTPLMSRRWSPFGLYNHTFSVHNSLEFPHTHTDTHTQTHTGLFFEQLHHFNSSHMTEREEIYFCAVPRKCVGMKHIVCV